MQIQLWLVCSVCTSKHKNYLTSKTKATTKKLELNKYCKYCRKTRLHKEELLK